MPEPKPPGSYTAQRDAAAEAIRAALPPGATLSVGELVEVNNAQAPNCTLCGQLCTWNYQEKTWRCECPNDLEIAPHARCACGSGHLPGFCPKP